MAEMSVEDLRARVGETVGVSEWILVDQPMINLFADATLDHQFIHVRPEMAKLTPFGGTIAHGFLTLSLLSVLLEKSDVPKLANIKMGLNYGLNKVRFLSAVPSGARVRAQFKLMEFDEKKPGQFQELLEITVEIEGKPKPALIAEWLVQYIV